MQATSLAPFPCITLLDNMYKNAILSSLFLALISLSINAAEITQTITTDIQSFSIVTGDRINFKLNYDTKGKSTTGVGIKLSFDSEKLKFLGFTEIFEKGFLMADETARIDTKNEDNDNNTNTVASIAWMSVSGNWPDKNGSSSLLSVAHFEAISVADTVTLINITGDAAAKSAFIAKPVSVTIGEVSSFTSASSDSSSGGIFSWFLVMFLVGLSFLKYLSPCFSVKK